MHSTRPLWYISALAFVRLWLIFIALCLVLAEIDVAQRVVHNYTTGLPSPIFSREPLPPPSTVPFLGINVDFAGLATADIQSTVEELRATGFGWVRLRLAWDQIEPTPNHFEWQHIDRVIGALHAADLAPVLVLDGSPSWARARNDRDTEEGAFAPPAAPSSFARFAKAVATRYANQVRIYQIWDEPNIVPHWGARHIEPVHYARLLKAAATAIRQADPDAQILLAALAPTADRGHLALDEYYFLNRLYAAGAAPYFDAVAIQPFGFATRPDDPQIGREELNFRRTLWVRQTMLDAGDGNTPIWLVRYGWNRSPGSRWQSVSAELQHSFAAAALEMAYSQWPWVAAMGWPAATPSPNDGMAGFALTPALVDTFHAASTSLLTQPRPRSTPAPSLALWAPLGLWVLAAAALLWRGMAAVRKLPWRRWQLGWGKRPRWQQTSIWAILLLIYYLAVWPPVVLLCWVVAMLGFLAQPRIAIALALLFLPFHDYHKEFVWLSHHWIIPPTQAVLLCALPATWYYRPNLLPRDRWSVAGLSWAIIMALGATGAWYWPAFWRGILDLAIAPLWLFLLIRAWATTRRHTHVFAIALAAGGLFAAALGLIDWTLGGGTLADGVRRLTGPSFTANHAALYFIRTLALSIGLALAAKSSTRWQWGLASVGVGVALLLTGSRGALLLGLPAGALFLVTRRNIKLPSRRWLALMGAGVAVVAWMWRARLMNMGTVAARMDGWIVALALWREHFLFGVGPAGFWWNFPAFMTLTSNADPNLRHPHNVWLELAGSGGLLALVWLFVLILLLYRWVQSKQEQLTWVQVGLLTGLITGLAHAQMDAFQALPPLASWNWAALALLLTPALERTQSQQAQTKAATETGSGL